MCENFVKNNKELVLERVYLLSTAMYLLAIQKLKKIIICKNIKQIFNKIALHFFPMIFFSPLKLGPNNAKSWQKLLNYKLQYWVKVTWQTSCPKTGCHVSKSYMGVC